MLIFTYLAHNISIKCDSSAEESYNKECKICIAFDLLSDGSVTVFPMGGFGWLPVPLFAALLPKLIKLSSSPEVPSKVSGGQLGVGIGSSWTKVGCSKKCEI